MLPVIRPTNLSTFEEIACGMSTRVGGVSREPFGMNTSFKVGDESNNVRKNRAMFTKVLGIDEDRLAIPEQRHTSIVRRANGNGTYEQCDALVTDTPNVFLSVSVADCAAVFLYDPRNKAVGCVHAGWRGTEQEIVARALAKMEEEFGTQTRHVFAFVGPAAGSCCYEIGEEVAERFDGEFVERRKKKSYLDFKRANKVQLRSAGVPEVHIEVHDDCTICGDQTYHSFRRDGKNSGRMMGIIGLKE